MTSCVQDREICPFCNRVYPTTQRFLFHLREEHPTEIRPYTTTTDHYLCASITRYGIVYPFCMCLGCGRGAAGSPQDKERANWVRLHSKREGCRTHHAETLQEFLTEHQLQLQEPPAPEVQGHIYCLTNESLRPTRYNQYCKIGVTDGALTDVLLRENKGSPLPTPYTLAYSVTVSNRKRAWREAMNWLWINRVADSREFFDTDIDRVTEVFNDIAEMDANGWI